EFPVLPTARSDPDRIAAGPDGALWFTENFGNRIGRITTAGVVTNEYTVPTNTSAPSGITAGPDGALWFTESNNPTNKPIQSGRITTAGVITEFPIPSDNASPLGIAKGPDGALWFTESSLANKIGRLVLPGGCNKPLTDTHDFNADCLSDVLWYNTG